MLHNILNLLRKLVIVANIFENTQNIERDRFALDFFNAAVTRAVLSIDENFTGNN